MVETLQIFGEHTALRNATLQLVELQSVKFNPFERITLPQQTDPHRIDVKLSVVTVDAPPQHQIADRTRRQFWTTPGRVCLSKILTKSKLLK